ncbi:MAG TPA: serine hydrolase [Ignavibacteriaceae bacterium]
MVAKVLIIIICFIYFSPHSFTQDEKSFEAKEVKSLIEKFFNEDPWVNGEAIGKLVKIGEPAVDDLIISLQDKYENVRWCSAITLEKISPLGRRSIPFLINALTDESKNVRWCSALALGKFKSEALKSIPALQKLLYDDDYDVRWAAYVAILKIDKKSLNVIPDLLEKINIVEKLTPELMSQLKVPGVSISIIHNNNIAYSKSFGVADADTKLPVDINTMFEACSMSKPVFTLLVLQLVDQGKLDLDSPLSDYLPETFVSDDDYSKLITARMILSHTGGMPNWRKGDEERNAPIPIYFKPGTRFNYSGEGIYYLQRVVEKITNQSLENYARENLFDKLGLTSTSFIWKENFDKQIATGHNADGKCNERKKYVHSNAAYTLYTTADEYAKIIVEMTNPKIENGYSLSKNMADEMLTHQTRVDTREVIDRSGRNFGLFAFRGLGWAIDSTITGDVVYHSGANQTGFRCYSQFSPKDKSGIVIMTNGENGNELWRRLIKEIGDL